MLWNYHYEFGSGLLLEQYNMQKMQQIWTFKILEVVQQHILGVVGNVIHCTVTANLSDFPAVKEFWKWVKIWWNYRHNSVVRFFETQCILYILYTHIPAQHCIYKLFVLFQWRELFKEHGIIGVTSL